MTMSDDLSEVEYEAATEEFLLIEELFDAGILGAKDLPELTYWRWPVLKPELLPEWLQSNYNNYGEVRWYTETR